MDNIAELESRLIAVENGTNAEMNKKYFLNMHPVNSIYVTVDENESTPEAMALKYGGNWSDMEQVVL